MLTPEQIEKLHIGVDTRRIYLDGVELRGPWVIDTLRAYLPIVRAVAAESPLDKSRPDYPFCRWCNEGAYRNLNDWAVNHAPDCLYRQARELMGVK